MTTTSLRSQKPVVSPDVAVPDLGHDSPRDETPAVIRSPRSVLRSASVIVLLAVTAVLYLWTLSESGYANAFYSAAAQAGSESWKAFFFGSLDAGNSITVDKPPASLWLMALSVRVFGLSSWSILVPQALLGVATVATMYATVRRVFGARGSSGHRAGLAAGLITALTPAAALMFRFNNPDALLVFLLVLAGLFVLRATERAGARWLLIAGALIGLGFLTKMMQAFLVLPAFALVYLLFAPTTMRKRVLHLVGALVSVVVSVGWWVAIVELWPKSSRPYIDGTTTNSVLELVFGYNGFGRLTGEETGQVGGGGMGESTGILRLFQGVSGGMISWLLPAALLVLVVGLIMIGRAPRADRSRAALVLFGGSMITTALVFSFMAGIYHDYYTVALAPWIAGTVIIGTTVLWRQRHRLLARITLAAAVAATTAWAFVLLGQSAEQPYETLRWMVLGLGLSATAGLALLKQLPTTAAVIVLGLAGVTSLTGPAAYTVDTVVTPHTGSIVTAGPVSSFGAMNGGGPNGGAGPNSGGSGGPPGQNQNGQIQNGRSQNSTTPNGNGPAQGGFPGAAPGRSRGMGSGMGGGMGSGMGGLLNGTSVSTQVKTLLEQKADAYTWVAATVRAQNAASYQLATGSPVMAIGGFNGTTASPTLAQFKADVAAGKIHYFIASGDAELSASNSTDAASQIQSWVQKNFTAKTVGGTTVYDLTESK